MSALPNGSDLTTHDGHLPALQPPRRQLAGSILITGAAGFIGANFSRFLASRHPNAQLVLLDKVSRYSSTVAIQPLLEAGTAQFVKVDLADEGAVDDLVRQGGFDYIVNFAAESHNDRAILDSRPFVASNVVGAYNLIEAARLHGAGRIVHVSTIEVYGEQGPGVPFFTEGSPLNAKTPYSASKAAADLLLRAHMQTYPQLDLAITHCANNYGPWQFPEKLIPLAVTNVLRGRKIPLYGDGLQKRDWLHVTDHCVGIELVMLRERESLPAAAATDSAQLPVFDFSARQELTNRDIIRYVTEALGVDFAEVTESVADRPNHDRRYLIEPAKAERVLGFSPQIPLEAGIKTTVEWYVANRWWWEPLVERGLQINWAS